MLTRRSRLTETSAIPLVFVEMLMQSNASTIELLPAIPDEWADGSVDGIVARGNFELDLDWEDGELTDVEVLSKSGNVCKLNNPAMQTGNRSRSRL